jgi:hypothetical protein
MGANLALARQKKKEAAAVVQLGGSVLIWHMIEWVFQRPVVCCLYAVQKIKKNENRACSYSCSSYQLPGPGPAQSGNNCACMGCLF